MKLVKIERDGRAPGVTPEDWVEEVCSSSVQMYKTSGYQEPWCSYIATLDGNSVGSCSFKSPPEGGRVEITFTTFAEFEGRGVATKMVQQLVEMAMSVDRSLSVAAYTSTEIGGATKVLERNGFQFIGLVGHEQDGDLWEWILERSYH